MKIGGIIPVRLASERLPGKALMDMCGRPVIYHLLDRVAASRHIESPSDVVVCTTTETTDDPLEKAVKAYGASVFRGDINDIIRRFGDAIAHFGFDAVIQADGDDPCSAPEYMDATMDALLADPSLDIVTSEGLAIGCNVKSFTSSAMDKVLAAYRTERNDTGFADYFTKTGLCHHKIISPVGPEHIHDTARLTLDYQVDLDLFRIIFEALYEEGAVFGTEALVTYLNKHPENVAINLDVEEEYWSRHSAKSVLKFIDDAGGVRTVG